MLQRYIRGIGIILMLACAAAVAWFVFASPYQVRIVHTGSMGNTIPTGSAVVVHQGQYQIGQVVSFTINGETVTHRLIGIDSHGNTTTKGDANRSADPWHAPKSNIIGDVVVAPRYLGWFLYYLRQPTGLSSLLAIAACMLLLWGSDSSRRTEAVATPA